MAVAYEFDKLMERAAVQPGFLAHRGAGAPYCSQAKPARAFVVGVYLEEGGRS